MKVTLTILFLTVLSASAQNKGDFTFEIEANHIRYNNMDIANRFLRDTTGSTSKWYGDSYIKDTIKKSTLYGISLSYQSLNFMSFGLYGNYQFNRFERDYYFSSPVSDNPYMTMLAVNVTKIRNTSFSFGVFANVLLNKIFQFDKYESKFLKRFQFSIGIRGGVSSSQLKIGEGTKDVKILTFDGVENFYSPGMLNMLYNSFQSINWNGGVELKLGYRIVESKLFSTIGLKIGYQFHTTPVLTDKGGRSFQFGPDKEEVKLNFSGLYSGIYLNIGK